MHDSFETLEFEEFDLSELVELTEHSFNAAETQYNDEVVMHEESSEITSFFSESDDDINQMLFGLKRELQSITNESTVDDQAIESLLEELNQLHQKNESLKTECFLWQEQVSTEYDDNNVDNLALKNSADKDTSLDNMLQQTQLLLMLETLAQQISGIEQGIFELKQEQSNLNSKDSHSTSMNKLITVIQELSTQIRHVNGVSESEFEQFKDRTKQSLAMLQKSSGHSLFGYHFKDSKIVKTKS